MSRQTDIVVPDGTSRVEIVHKNKVGSFPVILDSVVGALTGILIAAKILGLGAAMTTSWWVLLLPVVIYIVATLVFRFARWFTIEVGKAYQRNIDNNNKDNE